MPGVTNTFSANTKIKSAEINQNFLDALQAKWADWTMTLSGMVAQPSYTYCRWCQVAKIATLSWGGTGGAQQKNGTSEQVTCTIPVAPKYDQTFLLMGYYQTTNMMFLATIPAGSTTMTIGLITEAAWRLQISSTPGAIGANQYIAWLCSNTISFEVA